MRPAYAQTGFIGTTPTSNKSPWALSADNYLTLNNIAKDRHWFTTYTPFKSTLDPLIGSPTPVHGIGTVKLHVKPTPDTTSYILLVLKDVLHVPDAICNILGSPAMVPHLVSRVRSDASMGGIMLEDGLQIAYFQRDRALPILDVAAPSGTELGPSVIVRGELYVLNCHWDIVERIKWEAYRDAQAKSGGATTDTVAEKKYGAREKAFLKAHFGHEFQFLRQYGLNIHKDKDREKGRAVLRALMRTDKGVEIGTVTRG